MRRGVTLVERGADKAADWEPLVLTSVGYSWRGLGGWSHMAVTQNHTSVQFPSWICLCLFLRPNLTTFVVQSKYIQLRFHELRYSPGILLLQHFDGFVLNSGCFDKIPHEATGSWAPTAPPRLSPSGGMSRGGAQSIKQDLFRNNHFDGRAEDSFTTFWLKASECWITHRRLLWHRNM